MQAGVEIVAEFQSLFYWIFLSELKIAGYACETCSSFNPCSIGFSFRSAAGISGSKPTLVFQSLFFWIFLSECRNGGYWEPWIDGFNPCSIGFSFRSWKRSMPFLRRGSVSILVLLDFPFGGPMRHRIHIGEVGFQSLFYWIFLSEARIVRSR